MEVIVLWMVQRKFFKFVTPRFFILLILYMLSNLFANPAHASALDYDCSDFGTQERAQHEFHMNGKAIQDENGDVVSWGDVYVLDADKDGVACEANPKQILRVSTSYVGMSLGLLIGMRRKKKGFSALSGIIPGLCVVGWLPIFFTAILRDYILPLSTNTTWIFFAEILISFGPIYLILSRTTWLD